MTYPRITLEQLTKAIDKAVHENKLDAKSCYIDYIFQTTIGGSEVFKNVFVQDIPPGSYFIGIEYVKSDHSLGTGTIYVEPEATSKLVN